MFKIILIHYMTACSNELFMQKRKREFFLISFAVILLAVDLPIVLKAEFSFELILYITILFS